MTPYVSRAIPSVPKKPTSTGSNASFSSTTNATHKRWVTRTSEPFSFTWRRRKPLLLPLRIANDPDCRPVALLARPRSRFRCHPDGRGGFAPRASHLAVTSDARLSRVRLAEQPVVSFSQGTTATRAASCRTMQCWAAIELDSVHRALTRMLLSDLPSKRRKSPMISSS